MTNGATRGELAGPMLHVGNVNSATIGHEFNRLLRARLRIQASDACNASEVLRKSKYLRLKKFQKNASPNATTLANV